MSDINVTVTNPGAASVAVSGGSTVSATVGNGGSVSVALGNVTTGTATVVSGTVEIGTVTTLAPGSSATVTNAGTSYNAVLNIGLPRGDVGPTGATGATGPANSLSVGTVTAGSTASATITGNAPSQTLNLVLPQGPAGSAGPQGPAGPANSLTVGTITTLAAGAVASASITGTAPSQQLSLSIPRGDAGATGPANTLSIGTVTTGAAGTSASASISGTAPNQTLSLTIPRGDTGSAGSTSWSAITGKPTTFPPSGHTHAIADVTGLQASLDAKQAVGTYATLVNGTIPSSQLPSFVDDVIDVGAALPATGETGKIYFISSGANANKTYRWSGSSFVEIVGSPSSTDAVPEGSLNLYFTSARAVAAVQSQLDGKASLSHTHTIAQVTNLQSSLDGKAALSHTHSIADVTSLQSTLDSKAALSHAHTISQVTGLQSAIDGKASTSHVHAISDVTNLQSTLDAKAPISHTHAISQVTNLQSSLDGKAAADHQHEIVDVNGLEYALNSKQAAGTYATLVNGVVPAAQLPSYVDDVVEVASLPSTGESGKIYVLVSGANAGRIYRWAGSTFVQIIASPGTTDSITEGSVNLFFTNARAIAAVQSQLDAKAPLSHTHTISQVVGLQAALDSKAADSHSHAIADVSGLQAALDGKAALSHVHAISNVTGLQAALDGKASSSHSHAIADVVNLESRLQFASTLTTPPASDTASGTAGQLALDATYLYGCIAANTWRRIAWEAYGSAAAGITVTQQPTDQSASSSGGVVSVSSAALASSTFPYSGTAATTYAQLVAFFNNGTVQYAASADYENLLFTKLAASSTWTGMLVEGTELARAATRRGEMDYSNGVDTVLHPYRHIAGNDNFIVMAREVHNWEYAYPQTVFMATTNTGSASPSFSRGGFPSGDNTSLQHIGACALAASPTMVVAALVNANKTYSYGNFDVSYRRVWSQYPLAYSTNGTTWATIALSQAAAVYDIIYSSGRFIALGALNDGSPRAWYSSNGLAWTAVSLPTGAWFSAAAGNGKVVAVGYPTNYAEQYVNSNGQTVTEPLWGPGDNGSLSQKVIVSSDNGATWTAVDGLPILETWSKVAYVPALGRFVAFAAGNQVCAASADGANWDAVSGAPAQLLYGDHAAIGNSLYIHDESSTAWKVDISVAGGGGGTATFTVTATAASTISYQWQKSTDYGTSYQNISGATASTLSLNSLSVSDNGTRYRCKLTAGGVTVYSNPATLTVSA